MQASGITSPGGSLALCYDERGREYIVPSYCFQASEQFVRPSSTAAPSTSPQHGANTIKTAETPAPITAPALGPPNGACIRLKVGISPGDFRLVVDTSLQESVATFQLRVADAATKVSPTQQSTK
jgi:hypothetical protein